MTESPSKYGGVAAVLVFGLGLLIVGFSLPAENHDRAVSMRWMGLTMLVFGFWVLAMVVSQSSAHKALTTGIAAVIYCGIFACNAASNEMTGTARYYRYYLSKGDRGEAVTREASPAKFREATNVLWGGGGVCVVVAAVSFTVYRKLED